MQFVQSRQWCIGTLILLSLSTCGCIEQRPIYYKIDSNYTVTDPQFSLTMGNLLGPPIIRGNKCETLVNGDEIFPAMLQALHSAQKTVTLETYIYWSGKTGKEFA